MATKTNNLPYTCKTCNKSYTTLQLCLSHELEHLTVHEDENYTPNKPNKKRPRRTNAPFLPEETMERIEFKNDLIQAFSNCPEGMELSTLCIFYQPNSENLSCVYERIYCDLIEQLNTPQAKWDIQPFGSTVTGLAFKNSDIDLYINRVDVDDDKPLKQRFKYVTQRIRKCPKFSNIIPINLANVPIIKCTHILTGYNIDINVSSKTGVYNSIFIAKLLSFDERIHPLMLTIKIWAKTWDITKQFRVTNYCLILLVIFFLQVCHPSILPSIKSLQEGIAPQIVKGINFACRNPPKRKRKTNNRKNIKNLVNNFFNFYNNFDYENKIICPYLGKILDKKEFLENKFPEYERQMRLFKELPDNSMDKTITSTELDCSKNMTLQDPFFLNQNKGGNLNDRIYIYIRKLIRHADKICSDSNSENLPSYNWLIRLFYEIPDLQQINLSKNPLNPSIDECGGDIKNPKSIKKSNSVNVCKFTPLETELSFVRSYLMKHFPNQMFNKMEINKFWVENIVKFITEVLTVIYKIEISPLNNESPMKSSRNEGQSDVHENDKYSINCKLHANCDFWSGRKIEVKKGHAAFFQEQIEITKRYENERRGNPSYNSGNLYCKFVLIPTADFSSVQILLEELLPKESRSSLKSFFNEFISRIRLFFKAYFESLIRQK